MWRRVQGKVLLSAQNRQRAGELHGLCVCPVWGTPWPSSEPDVRNPALVPVFLPGAPAPRLISHPTPPQAMVSHWCPCSRASALPSPPRLPLLEGPAPPSVLLAPVDRLPGPTCFGVGTRVNVRCSARAPGPVLGCCTPQPNLGLVSSPLKWG